MRRILWIFLSMTLFLFSSCKANSDMEIIPPQNSIEDVVEEDKRGKVDNEIYHTASVYQEIKILVGNVELEGILYDNLTSRRVAEMLPLTTELWHPALGFASAFNLPQQFSYFENEPPQRGYELGTLAYWMPGPSIAMIYNDDRFQTVVPVVPIGKILDDISFLESYEGTIAIELKS